MTAAEAGTATAVPPTAATQQAPASTRSANTNTSAPAQTAARPAAAGTVTAPANSAPTPGTGLTNWSNALTNIKKQGKVMLYANLINTDAVEVNDMTVEIRFNNGLTDFRKSLLQKPENMQVITKEVAMLCGKPMQIKLQEASGAKVNKVAPSAQQQPVQASPKEESPEDILESLDIPINYIEE